jgi:signal transduction histidine kinase
MTERVEERPHGPWPAIAITIAAVAGLFLLLALFAGVVLTSSDSGLGTGFGFVPFATADAGIVVAVVGLIVAAVIALVVAWRGRAVSRPVVDGSAWPRSSERRPLWVMLATAAGIAAASLLLFFAVEALDVSYGVLGDLVMIGTAAVAALGLVAAAVVTVLAFVSRRVMSLRARTFWVIVVVVLIPSACLAAFGVWAYYRSWETATNLSQGQASYQASELAVEVASAQRQRDRFTPAQRALLAGAIAQMYGRQGHREGAQLATLDQIRDTSTLPGWAIASLEKAGYAIGTERGPSGLRSADIVAWRVGPRVVRYYVPAWPGDSQFFGGSSFSAPVPVDRLVWIGASGVALIVVLGLLGAWILSRSVVRPVRRLAAASGRLAEGAAGVTVKPEGPRELRELAVSFNDMNAKLTKAQETEQAFLLSVSHELKTPLTSIRGYAEGIGDGTVKPDEGSAVIGAESSRLERLVGDLLESGRMRKAAFTVRSEAVDLAAVAEDVVRRYEATARDAGLTLLVDTEAGGGAVADHDRVLQVVSNLVENAIRCTPAPGTVTITTAPGAITVADTGRGLTSDDLPRAFERFYLYSRYGTDRPVGTGLGLAIVKELTEAMGGAVSVSSAVGVGTAFTVALPPADAAPTAPPPQDVTSSTAALPQDAASSTISPPQDDAP